MGALIINVIVFQILLFLEFYTANAQTWIRVGYWELNPPHLLQQSLVPISAINSTLFTHLICSSADINSTTYQLSFPPPDDEEKASVFTKIVRQKNPSVITLLSIGRYTNVSTLSSMVGNSTFRKSFIDSSIAKARLYGFQGLHFDTRKIPFPDTATDMEKMGKLFQEWRAATELEAKNSNLSQLILTTVVSYSPWRNGELYPIDFIQQYLNWVHVLTTDYSEPIPKNTASAPTALYDPNSINNTDYGLEQWMGRGLQSNKLVLSLPFYGYSWNLVNPKDKGIGANASGPADVSSDGSVTYQQIKFLVNKYGPNVQVIYNSTYVVNYCSVDLITWISFDDVEAIRAKIAYAKQKKLLGYAAVQVSYDDNWVLSQAAAREDNKTISSAPVNDNSAPANNGNGQNDSKKRLLVIISATAAASIFLLGVSICYCWMRKLIWEGKDNSNDANLIEYTPNEIEAATNRFSIANKLGEGGYGPVYRGVLRDGKEIAVKKLSETSSQGYKEFKNEVTLTAQLQHINLVKLLGFCIDKQDHMLIYEYMSNKSLDYYLFDPERRSLLDWRKRVDIIEGITQGLLYLLEYSRVTIIHRDLKASNVLLDEHMKPKISDFGMARIFVKKDLEANTEGFFGTLGIIPPEFVSTGTYSTKFDVYSFGILILQIISGKSVSNLYGPNQNLGLPAYAYQMWNNGKGMEFVDSSLDDTDSSCKLMRCLQIALLCVQENPDERPSMLKVSSMLKNEIAEVKTPKNPGFCRPSDEDDRNRAGLLPEILEETEN